MLLHKLNYLHALIIATHHDEKISEKIDEALKCIDLKSRCAAEDIFLGNPVNAIAQDDGLLQMMQHRTKVPIE